MMHNLRRLASGVALFSVLFLVWVVSVHAQGTWVAGNLACNGVGNNSFHYNYLQLGYTPTGKKAALLIHEHPNNEGSGWYDGSKTDPLYMSATIANGGSGAQDWYNNAAFQSRYGPLIVVSPYADQRSDTSGVTNNFGGYNDTPSSMANETCVANLIRFFLANFNVDSNRVYATGDSLGGIGSWALALDYGYKTGTVDHLVTAAMPFSGNISRAGGNPYTTAQLNQIINGGLILAVNGVGDGTSSNPDNWTSPIWRAIAGNSNYPGPPSGGQAGSSPYHYLLDTSGIGHDVWDTYRPLPAGQPLYDMLFAQTAAAPIPHSPLPSGYLSTNGNQIIAGDGTNVRLACIGYFTETSAGYASDMDKIRNQQGFNCIRVDLYDMGECPNGTCVFTGNGPGAGGMDNIVAFAGNAGLKVIMDHHGNDNISCLGQQSNGLWYDLNGAAPYNVTNNTDGCGDTGRYTYAQFKSDMVQYATHYNGNTTVIGFDLHNEPLVQGLGTTANICWGCGNGADIKAMFADVGAAVHAANPGALIIAEGPVNYTGTSFSGKSIGVNGTMDLSAVGTNGIGTIGNKLVYSVHDYTKTVTGSAVDSGTLMQTTRSMMWGYLVTQNLFPVFIGEMGASLDNSNNNLVAETAWATDLVSYVNGNQSANGGPTFTTTQQPISTGWFGFGSNGGEEPDGTLNPDGTNRAGQYSFYSQLQYTASGGGSGIPYTFTHPSMPVAANNSVSVRDANNTSISATSNTFAVTQNLIGPRVSAAAPRKEAIGPRQSAVGPAPSKDTMLGMYIGDAGSTEADAASTDFFNAVAPLTVKAYIGYIDNSQAINTWRNGSAAYVFNGMKSRAWSANLMPVIGIPMTEGASNAATDFPAIAAGQWDQAFTDVFDVARLAGFPTIYVRLGWEMNGNWEPWSVTPSNVNNWNAAFAHVANLAHNYVGMNIYTVWNPAAGGNYGNPNDFNAFYPGDQYVDVISIDVYGYEAGHASDQAPLDAGDPSNFTILGGMKMASQHNKPFAYPEIGAGSDNTTFPNNVAQAVASSPYKPPVAFFAIWDCVCGGYTSLKWTDTPNSVAAWKNAYAAVQLASNGPPVSCPAPGPESPNNTVVTTAGPVITDSHSNQFAISAAGQILINCVVDPVTNSVIKLAYVGHVLWQLNTSQYWYSYNGSPGNWSAGTTTSPLPPPTAAETISINPIAAQRTGVPFAIGGVVTNPSSSPSVLQYSDNGGPWQSTTAPGPVTATRQYYEIPGGAGSAWVTPFGAGATWSAATDADTIDISRGWNGSAYTGPYGNINTTDNFGATEYIGKATDPQYTFTNSVNGRTKGIDSTSPLTATLHVPNGARTPGPYPGDNAIVLMDPINAPNRMYTFGIAGAGGIQPPGLNGTQGPFSTGDLGEWDDATSDQFGEDYDSGLSGNNNGAGLINYCDVTPTCNTAFPRIQHAFRYETDAHLLKENGITPGNQVVKPNSWPLRLQDGQSGINLYVGNLTAGATLGIPSTAVMPNGLDTNCQGFFWSLQHYPSFFRDMGGGGLNFTADQVADTSAYVASLRGCLPQITPFLRVLRNQHQGGQDFAAFPKNGPGARTDTGPPPLAGTVVVPPPNPGSNATTWNPGDAGAGITLSGNNLVATSTGITSVRSTTSYTTGKVCWEIIASTISQNWTVGLTSSAYPLTLVSGLGSDINGIGEDLQNTQNVYYNNAVLSGGGTNSANGEAATQCADFGAKLFWSSTQSMRADGHPWNSSATANPATGTGGDSFSQMTCPCFITYNNFDGNGVATLNAGGPFVIAMPAGFAVWQQAPTVTKAPNFFIFGANDNKSPAANDDLMQQGIKLASQWK